MTAQVAADLRAAADVLRRDGWIQLSDHAYGGHCASGAIEVAIDPEWEDHREEGWEYEENQRFSEATLRLCRLVDASSVTGWNDAPGRTADEVIAALEAAAEAAEARP
jgi:hypothetical protein